MAKTRKAESKTVMEARAELAGIIADLRPIRARALAIARRLERADERATPTVEYDGELHTEEWFLAGAVRLIANDHLSEAIQGWGKDARGTGGSLAKAAALEAKRAAKREATDAKMRDLLTRIKACLAGAAELPGLQGEFREAAHEAFLLRRCWMNDKAWVEVLTNANLTVKEMDLACGGRY